jgi:hypothetical protein
MGTSSNGTRKVSDIVWREDLYPRIKPDPAVIQRYAADLTVLPPVEVNQHNELIDGYHRWTAHKKAEASEIAVTVTETASEAEFIMLACRRNAKHGLQLDERSKKSMAVRLYGAGTGLDKKEIADALSVSDRTVNMYLGDIDKQLREERRERIAAMWLACFTDAEIGEAVGVPRQTATDATAVLPDLEALPKSAKHVALFEDSDWTPQLYDVWGWAKRGDQAQHFGNSHIGIVENLLYMLTEPFGIVVDPFAGGGSAIEACRKRSRRYWVSDRKRPEELAHEIGYREHDLATGVAGPYHWTDVQLVYLDPPYWKQAAGKYSDAPTDLANMDLAEFNSALARIIDGYAKKLKPGAHLALIISPTQWPNEDKMPIYHDLDMIAAAPKSLALRWHIVCPYSSEQYNGTQVEIAKGRRLPMVLSRRLVVWEKV